jgi:hypothetical protein
LLPLPEGLEAHRFVRFGAEPRAGESDRER